MKNIVQRFGRSGVWQIFFSDDARFCIFHNRCVPSQFHVGFLVEACIHIPYCKTWPLFPSTEPVTR